MSDNGKKYEPSNRAGKRTGRIHGGGQNWKAPAPRPDHRFSPRHGAQLPAVRCHGLCSKPVQIFLPASVHTRTVLFPCARSRGQAHPVCLPASVHGTKAAGILSISRSAMPHWKLISRLCAAAVPAGRSAKAGRRPDTHGFCRSQRLHHKALFSLQTRSPAWHDTARSVSRARQARVPATGREKCDLPGYAPFHAMFFLLYGISPDLSAVGGKLMRRRALFSAPHGFDVNDSIVFIFCFSFLCRICSSLPRTHGNTAGGLIAYSRSLAPHGSY